MIMNIRTICLWETGESHIVYMPALPACGDTVVTPQGTGKVTDRLIDAVSGKITVYLKKTSI